MKTTDIITTFTALAKQMEEWQMDNDLLEKVEYENAWFQASQVKMALSEWKSALTEQALESWLGAYPINGSSNTCVGIVAAGNIPMVGLHDLLCVIASGLNCKIKLSDSDRVLMTEIVQFLNNHLPSEKRIEIVERLNGIDAVIATGSNNTSRYFEYYFRTIPSVIRKNRSSVAVIRGDESIDELKSLAGDMYHYFGLGCRNVSKIYLPENYQIEDVIDQCEAFSHYQHHHKYINNYTYHKAIFLMNQDKHLDNGFTLFRQQKELHAPLAVIHYDVYRSEDELNTELEKLRNEIQIIMGKNQEKYLPFGTSQHLKLSEYADNVDVMNFIHELKVN
jgi:hypothetical protein